LKRHALQFHHEFIPLSKKEKSMPTRDGGLKASLRNRNSEVSLELDVATNNFTDLKENVSNDKNSNINKRSNIKLYNPFRYQCTQCPKKCSFCTVLAAHMLKHKKQTYKFTSCAQDFQHKVELQKHMLENHSNIALNASIDDPQQTENEAVILDNVGGGLNQISSPHTIQSLSTQNSNPSKESNPVSVEKMTCSEENNVSGDRNGDSSNISQEFNSEASIPSTSICNHTSGTKNSLERGCKKTKGYKRLICHVCGMDFHQKNRLIHHLHSVHGGRRDFKCSFCQKGFSEKVGRDDHEWIHTGEKPYRCDLCDKSFLAKAMPYCHKRYHFKTLESYCFQCMHCPKTFYFQSALAAHMRKHTGERQYICAHCSKGFYCRICLAKHTLRFHSEAPLDTKVDKVDPLQKENISMDAIDTKHASIQYNCK
jgi:hypothetical protein